MNIAVFLPTKDRYEITLPLVLNSVVTQTLSPNLIVILNDSSHIIDLSKIPIYKCIFEIAKFKHIEIKVLNTFNNGLVKNYKKFLEYIDSNYKYIDYVWKMDDDCVPNTKFIENAKTVFTSSELNAGAYSTFINIPYTYFSKDATSERLVDIFNKVTPQLSHNKMNNYSKVEHIHCTYIYNRHIQPFVSEDYIQLSKIGNREDTIFTNEIFRKGYDLIIDGSIISTHLRVSTGGTRGNKEFKKLYNHDDDILKNYMYKHKIKE